MKHTDLHEKEIKKEIHFYKLKYLYSPIVLTVWYIKTAY